MATKALRDCHLRDFEDAWLYEDERAAADSLTVCDYHHDLSARLKDIACWIVELDEVLFLDFEVSCDPRLVEVAKGILVASLKESECDLWAHGGVSGLGYLKQCSSHVSFSSDKNLCLPG
jgi:hypothetical protein